MVITFLRKKDRETIQHALESLHYPVHLLLFIPDDQDEYGTIAHGLLEELVILHPMLSLGRHTLCCDSALATAFAIDKTPAILVTVGTELIDPHIRFCGLPTGYSFPILLEVILMVGGAMSCALMPETVQFVVQLTSPMHLRIFVTAANDACAAVVLLACQLAHISPYISIEVVELLAFPELSERYAVRETPSMVINERVMVEGKMTESELIHYLRMCPNESNTAASGLSVSSIGVT